MPAACAIVVESLEGGGFRASCTLFPDCEAVAATEEEARRAVEEAIEQHLRWRQAKEAPEIERKELHEPH
jgi:predicted RNase H-like HicB family nuclease